MRWTAALAVLILTACGGGSGEPTGPAVTGVTEGPAYETVTVSGTLTFRRAPAAGVLVRGAARVVDSGAEPTSGGTVVAHAEARSDSLGYFRFELSVPSQHAVVAVGIEADPSVLPCANGWSSVLPGVTVYPVPVPGTWDTANLELDPGG